MWITAGIVRSSISMWITAGIVRSSISMWITAGIVRSSISMWITAGDHLSPAFYVSTFFSFYLSIVLCACVGSLYGVHTSAVIPHYNYIHGSVVSC